MSTWTVHAFRLTAYRPPAVYVGVSCHRPAVRLRQHLEGYKSSRHVRSGKPELAEDLYDHLAPFWSRDLAEDAADELAASLIGAGYDVWCDPNRLARIRQRAAASTANVLSAVGAEGWSTGTAHRESHDRYAA